MEPFAWVVILANDQQGKARTASFVLPKKIQSLVEQGIELGVADDIVFDRKNSKQQSSAVSILTNDVITRSTYYEQAVTLAAVPFIKSDLYHRGQHFNHTTVIVAKTAKLLCLIPKMRIILFSIISIYSSFSLAQIPIVMTPQPVDWTLWKEDISDSIKLSIVKRIDHSLINEYYNQYDWIKIEEDLDDFKFIDLDLNGELEILYEGFSGGEPIGVTIFKLNNMNQYEEMFSRYGTLEGLWRNSIDGWPIIELISHPSADIGTYSKETWTFNGSGLQLEQKLNWQTSTIFPAKFSNPLKFEVVNDPYTLRYSPKIESSDNVITSYKSGDIGYALAESKDATGRVWWFVMMTNNITPRDQTFYDYSYDDKYYSLGWMSSRYLKRTKK